MIVHCCDSLHVVNSFHCELIPGNHTSLAAVGRGSVSLLIKDECFLFGNRLILGDLINGTKLSKRRFNNV
jgi:hypothetical protein